MKRTVSVEMLVEVEVDETKFTPEFMGEFRDHFFGLDTVEEHIEHLAQLEAREVLSQEFTEGYGPLKDFGIVARVIGCETSILSEGGE